MKFLKLCALLLLCSPAHGVLGTHNGFVSLGLGLAADGSAGLIYNLDIGYQMQWATPQGIVQAVTVWGGFEGSYYGSFPATPATTTLYGKFAASYGLGRDYASGRLVFDLLGLGMEFVAARIPPPKTYSYLYSAPTREYFYLVLPLGTMFYFRRGLSLGFQHSLITDEYRFFFKIAYTFSSLSSESGQASPVKFDYRL